MDHKLAQDLTRKAMGERIRYVVQRRQEVAKAATCGSTSDEVAARIICEFTDYITTHLGRNADGTTRYKTCRIRDYKHRKGRRREAVQTTFAHNVDLHRRWLTFRASFAPGGTVWVHMGRVQKRRIRAALYEADLHVQTYGDYVGAVSIIKGM